MQLPDSMKKTLALEALKKHITRNNLSAEHRSNSILDDITEIIIGLYIDYGI